MPEASPNASPAAPAVTPAAVVAAVVAEKTGDVKPPEVPATPPPKAEPTPDSTAPRFQALARESKRVAQEKQALAVERARLQAEIKAERDAIAAVKAKADEIETLRKNAGRDPDAYWKAVLGDDYYDKLTEMRLSGKAPASVEIQAVRDETKAEIEKIRQEREEERKAAERERQTAAESAKARAAEEEKAIVAQFREETMAAVKGAAEKYEYITATGSEATVVQVIMEMVAATTERDPESGKIIKPGRVMTWEEAADAVEAELEKSIEKAVGGKKWSARVAAKPRDEPASTSARTLTNESATGAGGPASGAEGAQDRYARFEAAYQAELAKRAK